MPKQQPHLSDLIVILGDQPTADIAGRLMARPGLDAARVERHAFPWGSVLVQTTFGDTHAPIDRSNPVFVGRPVVRAAKHDHDASPGCVMRKQGGLSVAAESISETLSGMFAAFEFDETGIRVLTDRMGFRPVYIGHDANGEVRSIGTHAECVAAASGTGDAIDEISIAELLVHNDITFPFTTRKTTCELPPASVTTFDVVSGNLESTVLWEPVEPKHFPPASEMRARMREAMLEAGRDLTRGCERIGVLLSGGADSRAVLGAVLAAVDDPRHVTGLTYVTRDNNETAVAARVAEMGRCRHVLVRRDEHYFPRMLRRGPALIGSELRGNCHGLGIADNRLADRFDAVIGGQLSDTMLKDHFMDITTRAKLRRTGLKHRIRQAIPGLRRPLPVSPPGHTTGRAQLEPVLTEEMRTRVRARRAQRLAEVQRIRPTTGAVWHRFWPGS
ncbi:MAG: asparagine synthase-related protein, partial [Planctomycetota bacterium]